MADARKQVRQLFTPRSIALIGATDKSRWSWNTFGNLQLHGFSGPVYLVNPRGIPVHGQQSYARVADLPPGVDLAFVMVPASVVLSVLAEVADHGIPSVVLLTSGFAEVGDEGAELERQVTALARRRGLTILGPNGNGYINAAAGITPYGLPIDTPLPNGTVGVVLQSGALASSSPSRERPSATTPWLTRCSGRTASSGPRTRASRSRSSRRRRSTGCGGLVSTGRAARGSRTRRRGTRLPCRGQARRRRGRQCRA